MIRIKLSPEIQGNFPPAPRAFPSHSSAPFFASESFAYFYYLDNSFLMPRTVASGAGGCPGVDDDDEAGHGDEIETMILIT